jgi:TetR/AcrR family transcriptional repressor of mexJK operon
MPPRKEQDFEERRRQIIDGALHVFAGKGFEKATNKDIAAAAGVGSPGLIYHYFKDKGDLFRQVVEQKVPLLQLIAHPEEILPLPPAEALLRFGRAYLRILDSPEAVALFKLVIGEAARRPRVAQMFNELGPNRVFRFLAEYLQRQMDAGALRRADPNLAARCFFSPLVVFVLTREVFGQPEARALDPETLLMTTIDIFLKGMEPR